jgi:hypothetical protein
VRNKVGFFISTTVRRASAESLYRRHKRRQIRDETWTQLPNNSRVADSTQQRHLAGGTAIRDQRTEIAAVPVDQGCHRDRGRCCQRLAFDLPLKIKVHATFHLTNNLVFPFIILAGCSTCLLCSSNTLGCDCHIHSLCLRVPGSFSYPFPKDVYADWRRRIFLFPVFMAGAGFRRQQQPCVLEGLFKKSEFVEHGIKDKRIPGPTKGVPLKIRPTGDRNYSCNLLIFSVISLFFKLQQYEQLYSSGLTFVSVMSLKLGSSSDDAK